MPGRRPLSLDEASALIGAVVQRHAGGEPAARVAWLETHRGYGHFQPVAKGDLTTAVFEVAYERVLGELHCQLEQRPAERGGDSATTDSVRSAATGGRRTGTGSGAEPQVRIAELLTLYRAVLSTLGEYGALTGKHTHTPAVRRALEPLIEELKQHKA
jgi:hypothetical protein